MSSIPQAEPQGQSTQRAWLAPMWQAVAPYTVPPAAAGIAIVPVFYGFMAKSALQMGGRMPPIEVISTLKKGCQTAPTVGAIVGTQMIVQNLVEKALQKGAGNQQTQNFPMMLASAAIVGALSAPILAVFNGQTMGQTAFQSLKSLSAKQTSAIVARETSFLFSLRVSEPIAKEMERLCGKSPAVDYGSAFVSGVVGSLIGHPADTALTLWQKGMKVKNARQLMRGGPAKAVAVGGFSMGYKKVTELLSPASE